VEKPIRGGRLTIATISPTTRPTSGITHRLFRTYWRVRKPTRESQTFGLAAPGGTVCHTGIGGVTLGGGQSQLMRHGLPSKHAAEVVRGNPVHRTRRRASDAYVALCASYSCAVPRSWVRR
jgi:hypothetical protein